MGSGVFETALPFRGEAFRVVYALLGIRVLVPHQGTAKTGPRLSARPVSRRSGHCWPQRILTVWFSNGIP